jgi:hypothetical protein
VGINGVSINNVNADRRVVSPEYLPEVAKIADALRPWGVRVAVSIDFGSPQSLGKLDTFDPVDPKVVAWWKETVDQLYTGVPDLGGIVIKADSEGRVGPSAYKRTHADAANVVARALAPHGGRWGGGWMRRRPHAGRSPGWRCGRATRSVLKGRRTGPKRRVSIISRSGEPGAYRLVTVYSRLISDAICLSSNRIGRHCFLENSSV